jgi:hypothetical protein
MADRRRVALFALLVVACLVVAGIAIAGSAGSAKDQKASAGATSALAKARDEGRQMVIFRSLTGGIGSAGGDQVALDATADAAASPTRTSLHCERVYFAGGRGLCLARGSGFAAGYKAEVFGPDFKVQHSIGVAGVPSRVRVSPDGRYGSVTLFVTGHSYAAAGTFSTATTLIDMATGQKMADLEQFQTMRDGKLVTAVDVNYWGVTFARDSDTFYATLATGGKTFLIKGSVRQRTATVLKENVECPSLSPDGTRIAYKKRSASSSRPWHLTVLDLKTLRETPVARVA